MSFSAIIEISRGAHLIHIQHSTGKPVTAGFTTAWIESAPDSKS